MTNTDSNTITDFINRRMDTVMPGKEKLKEVLTSGKKLRLYQGFDPSSPNLHIGHLVGLLTLKKFQDLGHEVIFLIGDFTGMIGDPTGKSQVRNAITFEQVTKNAETYKTQASMILNFSGDNPIQLKRNSEWNQPLSFADVIKLSQHFTVQQMIERDMFQTRLKANKEIHLNEFFYPLVQGFDSVAMEVDLEVGGSDQLFNMMAGRKLVKKKLNKEKFVVTTPLLSDSSGKKIGKSEGNAINIINPPEQFFGQIMSLPDDAIMPCFNLITEIPTDQLSSIKQEISTNPMQAKKKLATELLTMLQGQKAAEKGRAHFEKTIQGSTLPENIPTISIKDLHNKKSPLQKKTVAQQTEDSESSNHRTLNLTTLLTATNLIDSKSNARRLIQQGAIQVNEVKITDPKTEIEIKDEMIIKAGKRKYLKITK